MTQLSETCEAIQTSLRSLYAGYGYTRYKMNRFEEYDLYARNKDFLVSDSVITFTDVSGKLLALKPDVTLSIVKNSRDENDALKKVYYNENVYRVTKGTRKFKEITQVGLECIGRVDDYCLYEVLKLALGSLEAINPSHVLSVSHLGILSEVLAYIGIPAENEPDILKAVGEKNLHELSAVLERLNVDPERGTVLKNLLMVQGPAAETMKKIRGLVGGIVKEETLVQLEHVIAPFAGENKLWMDFSVVNDLKYYNGFVFKGFVEGIPAGVLSGGQYDRLLKQMGKCSGAVGFAVYMDLLEQYSEKSEDFDVDTLLLYDETCTLAEITEAEESLRRAGASVLAATSLPKNVKYRRVENVKKGETT